MARVWKREQGIRKIGIDLDDTLFDFAKSFREFLLSQGIIVPENENGHFFLRRENIPEEERQRLDRIFYRSEYFLRMSLLPGALEAMDYLSPRYDAFAVTARDASLIKDTASAIQRYFPNHFCGLFHSKNYFNGANPNYPSKADVCWNMAITEMFEDSFKYGTEIAERGISVTLFGERNGHTEKELRNITFVKDWKEFMDKEMAKREN